MTAITKTQRAHLKKMNKAAKDASFDTNITNTGSLVVTTAQMSASKVTILDPGATHGYQFQFWRSGSPTAASAISASFVAASGSLNIMPNGGGTTGTLLAGDVIYYLLW